MARERWVYRETVSIERVVVVTGPGAPDEPKATGIVPEMRRGLRVALPPARGRWLGPALAVAVGLAVPLGRAGLDALVGPRRPARLTAGRGPLALPSGVTPAERTTVG